MYLSPGNSLDGFNPLKAIGRALGSTGRALVSAIPGVGGAASAVLETAARQPAKAAPITAVPTVEPSAPAPTVAPVSTTQPPATPSTSDKLLEAVLTKFVTSQPTPQPVQQPIMTPSAPSIVVAPSGPSAPAAAALPPWAIPAMIGAVGLMFVMSQKK